MPTSRMNNDRRSDRESHLPKQLFSRSMFFECTNRFRIAALVLFGLAVGGGDAWHWIGHDSGCCTHSCSAHASCGHEKAPNHSLRANYKQQHSHETCAVCRFQATAAVAVDLVVASHDGPLLAPVVSFEPSSTVGQPLACPLARGPPVI